MRTAVLTALLVGFLALTVGTVSQTETAQPSDVDVSKSGAQMVRIPGGVFTMGSQDGPSKAQPVHQVHLDAFYIEKYEVTTARYSKFLEANPSQRTSLPMFWDELQLPYDGDRPVVGVIWKAAEAYCQWAGRRLPTEAEWEKAARGTDGRIYPWGDTPPSSKLANYDKPASSGRYSESLRPVDSYEAGKSPYGVFGMAGNASEWVADWFGEKYYATSHESNPSGPARGQQKVIRGGSFDDPAMMLKAASRDSYWPTDKGPSVGFRCARDGS